MNAGDVWHYSAIDGWTIELVTAGEPMRLTLRGAFIVGFRLIRAGIAGWFRSRTEVFYWLAVLAPALRRRDEISENGETK